MNDLHPYVEDVIERARHLKDEAEQVMAMDAMTMEEGFEVLVGLREAKASLLAASQAVAEYVNALMPTRVVDMPGMGPFTKSSGFTRAWNDERALRELVAVARESREPDDATGEVERPDDALVRLLTSCAKIDYWRVRALESVGLKASNLSRWEKGRPGVQLPKRGE